MLPRISTLALGKAMGGKLATRLVVCGGMVAADCGRNLAAMGYKLFSENRIGDGLVSEFVIKSTFMLFSILAHTE